MSDDQSRWEAARTVGELAARCRATSDHAERAALLGRMAEELAAQAQTSADPALAETLSRQAAAAGNQARRERTALAQAADGQRGR